MSNKTSNIKERVLQIPDNKGITKQEFFRKIGMSYGNFTGKSKNTPLNSNAISNISSIYPDINIEWLVNGKGPMINSKNNLLSIDINNESIVKITKTLYENNDVLMQHPLYRQYIKSNIDLLEIEERERELKEKKELIKAKLLKKITSKD
ncbi:hypothetical protein [Tenacibaculum maritimum]|uniref:hypothetical protein n=1 Tax=Tenacibaculum maritimum TaxID=107401 RepID=UPI00040BE0AA|nr:hypothetical protein [Tenacibaculum maritimum]